MQRFFFNLHECGVVLNDEEGCEFDDVAAARAKALEAARAVMCAELSEGRLCLGCHIEVVDEHGDPVYMLRFKDAVELSGV